MKIDRSEFLKAIGGTALILYAANKGIINPSENYYAHDECKEFGTWVPLPQSIDAKVLKAAKVKFEYVIDMTMRKWGVDSAKRGWLESQFVITEPAAPPSSDILCVKGSAAMRWYIPDVWIPPIKMHEMKRDIAHIQHLYDMSQNGWPGYNRDFFENVKTEGSHDMFVINKDIIRYEVRTCFECYGVHPDYSNSRNPKFVGHRETCSQPSGSSFAFKEFVA